MQDALFFFMAMGFVVPQVVRQAFEDSSKEIKINKPDQTIRLPAGYSGLQATRHLGSYYVITMIIIIIYRF